jgi:hypothetical protein
MTLSLPDDDDQLLVELGGALRSAGRGTEREREAARAAYAWRSVDEDLALVLAELVYDSAVHERPLLRGATTEAGRSLLFEGPAASIEVEVTPDGLTGTVLPPGRAEVTLFTADGPVATVSADDMGGFTLGAPPAGPVRLHCGTATASLLTEWVRL